MKILDRFREWRLRVRQEKKMLKELPEGAVPGFTDELFIETGKHHKKEQRRAQ